MKNLFTCLFVISCLFITGHIFAQAEGDYRSNVVTGNWGDASTWERFDGADWVPAVSSPTSSDGVITIRNGHTITVASSVTVDEVIAEAGASIIINSSVTLTIANGAGKDLVISGGLYNAGVLTLSSGVEVDFNDGSYYSHEVDNANVPKSNSGSSIVVNWHANSTVEIKGWTSTSGKSGVFTSTPATTWGNIIFNFGGAFGSNINFGGNLKEIAGNLVIENIGTTILRLTASGPSNVTINIAGDLIIKQGTFQFSGGSSATNCTLNIGGSYTQSGGTFHGNSGATDIIPINFIGSNNTFTHSGGTLTQTSWNWNVKNGASITLNNSMTLATNRTFTVENGGRLFCEENTISGPTFTLESGGTLGIGSADGITSAGATGNIRTTTRNFNTSANYIYNGTSAQVTGSGLPATVNNLTIDNAADVTLSNNLQVNGTLLKVNGDLLDGGFDLTFGATSSTGVVQTLNAPSNANVGSLGAVITSGANLGETTVTRGLYALSGNSNNSINRWYKITPTNNTGLNATLVFPYSEGAELNGIAEGNLRLFRSTDDGATWTMITTGGPITVTHNQTENTFTVTGLDGFSLWTLGDADNPLPVELTSFSAAVSGKVVNLNWQTSTEVNNYGFEIERASFRKNETTPLQEWIKVGFVEGHGNSNSPKVYSFNDKVENGKYSYRLKQIDIDGKYEYSNELEVDVNVPLKYSVSQNYPNPFNPSTRIEYNIPAAGNVSIKLYDAIGNQVKTLLNEKKEAGSYIIDVDAGNLSNGVYFYQIRAGEFTQTKKMILVK